MSMWSGGESLPTIERGVRVAVATGWYIMGCHRYWTLLPLLNVTGGVAQPRRCYHMNPGQNN